MPDLHDLDSFDEGLPVTPLPPADVRRRGDRIRRRNTTLTSIGVAAAAVLAIGVPVAVSAGSGNDAQEPPVATGSPTTSPSTSAAPTWLQQIPDGFPIAEGFGATDYQLGDSPTAQLKLCGADPLAVVGTEIDALAADGADANSDGGEGRDLRLFADDATATAAYSEIQSTLDGCSTYDDEGVTHVFQGRNTDAGGEDVLAFTDQVRLDATTLSDLTFYQVTRTGNAVLVTASHTSAGGDQVAEQVGANLAERTRATVAAMCVFSADPCAPATTGEPSGVSSSSSSSSSAPAVSDGVIPDDFPLLDGFPTSDQAEPGAGSGRNGPSRDLDPIDISPCDTVVAVPDDHVDLLTGSYSDVEDGRFRQLVTFSGKAAADDYVTQVLDAFAACPEQPNANGTSRTVTVRDVGGRGDRSGGAVTQYLFDGSPMPGLSVVTVTRVGSAVLLTLDSNEGMAEAGVPGATARIKAVQEATAGVYAAMAGL